MGRGKSANVTSEFLDEQKTRIITELEKYVSRIDDGKTTTYKFSVDIPGLVTRVGGNPNVTAGLKADMNTLLSNVVLANDPSSVSNVPKIGKAVAPLHKPFQQWVKSAETYRLTDEEKNAALTVLKMLKEQDRTPSWGMDLRTMTELGTVTRFNLGEVSDPDVSTRYNHAINEIGEVFKPYVDVLNVVFSTRTTNRRKRASYGLLDEMAETMTANKTDKLDAYKEFSNILTQVESALTSIGKLIASPPDLASLNADLNVLTNQASTQDSQKNLQLD